MVDMEITMYWNYTNGLHQVMYQLYSVSFTTHILIEISELQNNQ